MTSKRGEFKILRTSRYHAVALPHGGCSDDWNTWNSTMLPETDESNSGGISGEQQADHPGALKPSGKADNPPPRKKG